jgi:imidazolonepropionase-like amidohydrolase
MKRISRRALLGGSAALFAAGRALADAPPSQIVRAIAGGRLLRPGQPALDSARIEIADGKIGAVSTGAAASAEGVIDARGKIVTAGFTDLLTSVGLIEIDLERSARDDIEATKDPVRAAFLAADGYNPASSVIAVTRREGVTSVGAIPHGGLVSGQSVWADLDGATADEALGEKHLALHVFVDDGSWYGGSRLSRGTALLRLRELFEDARAFKQNAAQFERRQLRRLAASRLDLAALRDALDGRLSVVFHVDRASDILAVLGLAKTHKLRPVLASAAEAWKVAREIAAAQVPVVVYPLDNLPRSFAALGSRDDNAALLSKAGVRLALSTGETHNARKLRQVAGNAIRGGLDRDQALAAVTREPARAVGLEKRYGSVEPGRVANLVVWSGDPFELSTRAEAVIIRGRNVSLRSRQTALFERYR